MKGKNTKVKAYLTFIVTIAIIAGACVAAYIACINVGKSQQGTQTEITKQEGEKAATSDSNQDAEPKTTDADSQTTDENTADTETADAESTEENSTDKKQGIKLGLDLQGGVNIVYRPKLDRTPTSEEMSAAQALIQKRLDAKGYTEAVVALQGKDKINVDIPGVSDPQKAIKEIGAAGMLRFVDQTGKDIVTGTNVKKATPAGISQGGGQTQVVVQIEMDSEGTKLFSDFTKDNIGQPMLIMLDETLLSYVTISDHIADGKGMISGNFTSESAKELADGINAGALPFTLEAVNSDSVGPKLGMESLSTTMKAGVIGLIIILIGMVAVFRICGLAADIALVFYTALNILVLHVMGATLTLPGIAGTLLAIGMAVDANIIIFARIREELMVGRSVPAAVEAGFDKAFSAILDGNLTTIITAVVLYMFGSGLIKSFAINLGVGVIISMFTALAVTHIVIKSFIGMRIKNPALYAAFIGKAKKAE